MATAQNTIKTALRKIRVIGRGGNPNSAQSADALTELNALLNEMIGFGSSLQWVSAYTDTSVCVGVSYPAQRVLCRAASAITITLPLGTTCCPIPDGFKLGVVDVAGTAAAHNITIGRNGWNIDAAQTDATISTNGGSKLYMFRAELGDWKSIADLALGDPLPFPTEFDLGVALMLANRLSGEYGQQLAQSDLYAMMGAKNKLRNRYCPPPIMYPEGAVSNLGGATLNRYIGSSNP